MTLPLALDTRDDNKMAALTTVYTAAANLTDITLRLCAHRSQANITQCGCTDERDCDVADTLGWDEVRAQADVWRAVQEARPYMEATR